MLQMEAVETVHEPVAVALLRGCFQVRKPSVPVAHLSGWKCLPVWCARVIFQLPEGLSKGLIPRTCT